MKRFAVLAGPLLSAALALGALALPVVAQVKDSRQTTKEATGNKKPSPDDQIDRALRERRAQAQSLLLSLASDARNFSNSRLRARSLARVADALWEVDAERARVLFLKAWEAAEIADRESDQKFQEEIRRQQANSGGGFVTELQPRLRDEVLELVLRRDRALRDEFLKPPEGQEAGKEAAPGLTETSMAEVYRQLEAMKTALGDYARQHPNAEQPNNAAPELSNAEPEPSNAEPGKPVADQEQALLSQIEHARTSAERDSLYLQAAFLALERGDLRARDFVGKIEDSELRKPAQAYVDPGLAVDAIEHKQTEQALELVRIGELSHIQKAWVLTQCAKLLVPSDRDKALSLLDDASSEARRIDGSDANHPRALMAIAVVVKLIDPPRAWDATFEAVKAANSSEEFTGEDGQLTIKLEAKGHVAVFSNRAPDFDIAGIFGKLANDDYDRAVQLARGFQGEAPRANATIVIARAVLEAKTPASSKVETRKPEK